MSVSNNWFYLLHQFFTIDGNDGNRGLVRLGRAAVRFSIPVCCFGLINKVVKADARQQSPGSDR
jgi:hypothetical protein